MPINENVSDLFGSKVFYVLFCFFQGKNKFCSHANSADHIDILFVGVDDLFHNSESKAGSLTVFSTGDISFIKSLPDLL